MEGWRDPVLVGAALGSCPVLGVVTARLKGSVEAVFCCSGSVAALFLAAAWLLVSFGAVQFWLGSSDLGCLLLNN